MSETPPPEGFMEWAGFLLFGVDVVLSPMAVLGLLTIGWYWRRLYVWWMDR